MKKVLLLCDNQEHPVVSVLSDWCDRNNRNHDREYDVELVYQLSQLPEQGDFLFLVSCSTVVDSAIRARFRYTMVLHASDLPEGRGWSPHIWQILNGASYFTLSLIEAEDEIDSGRIFLSTKIPLSGHELYSEINKKLFDAEIALIEDMLARESEIVAIAHGKAQEQLQAQGRSNLTQASYYRKRRPEDSALDIDGSLASQFNLLRVCDPNRFPAFFDINGYRYTVNIEKVGPVEVIEEMEKTEAIKKREAQ